MNVFYFSTASLLAILVVVGFVFAIGYFLSRQSSVQIKLWDSSLMALATLFSIETFSVTYGLIPPADYVQGLATDASSNTVNDWISSAAVNMTDLYLAWILVLACVLCSYFIKRTGVNGHQPHQGTFYDHFGATGALAVMLTSMIYVFIVMPAYFDSHILILDKILFRGVIPYITVGLFVWVMLNVALLARRIVFQRQQDLSIEQGFDLLSNPNVSKQQVLDDASHRSALKNRLLEIDQISASQALPLSEYSQLVDQQSEMEREEIDISVLYLHTAMWAIPVLGFLGTVWGIAEAVSNLTPLLKGLSASELGGSQLADSLSGLGVAFDTTLVALTLSLPAMALISLLEKTAYEDMLVRNRIILQHMREIQAQ